MSKTIQSVPVMKRLPALIQFGFSGLVGVSGLAMLASCGGGGGGSTSQSGSTVANTAAIKALVSCVDLNRNLQCDDGDTSQTASAKGVQGFTVKSNEYVLLESRDSANQRIGLLVSQAGSNSVTGLSTLRAMLAANGKTSSEIAAIEAALVAAAGANLETALEKGFADVVKAASTSLAGLTQYSLAAATQKSVTPVLGAYSAALGSATTDVVWSSSEASSVRRQLSSQNNTVLNNSETNRLYLFDAAASTVSSREIDLVPPPLPALANYPIAVRRMVAAIDKAVSVFVDTASAATGFASAPVATPPMQLEPGKGIAGIQLVDGGKSAYVLLNMLTGKYSGKDCLSTSDGNEGLFKISLADTSSYRGLKQAPACVHSGFSLLSADSLGTRAVAWDATEKMLWVLDGATLQKQSRIDVAFDAANPPQALAITPGGRYLAVAATGRLTLVDLATGRLVAQLSGDWTSATQISFSSGARRVLIASDNQVHTVMLDDSLQLLGRTVNTVAPSSSSIRALTVAADGDSYVVASDDQVSWRSVASHAPISISYLAAGLSVQQAALAGKRLVVLARGTQDKQFKLIRMPIDLPNAPL